VAPTGKHVDADYVYVMHFTDGKISHMTKIWNAGWTIRELGWSG
jgi:ketosteroid isomerase-like protein